jgi:hypothetical protein
MWLCHDENQKDIETAVPKALAEREGQMKDFFHVISVFFVVFTFHKPFAFRRLRWNVAGYKNNFK